MLIPAYLIAIAIPILALWLIYRFDLYKTGEFQTILLCFFAGAVAVGAAGQLNGTLIREGWLERMDVIRYAAPIIEEILKGLVLWALVRRARFTYFVEGAVYGFAAGIGFAVLENFQYIAKPEAGLAIAVSRVFSTNLIHAATCALLGIALGLARFERGARRFLLSAAGLLIAMLLHIGFNNMVTRVGSGLLLAYAVASGLCGAAIVIYAIRWGFQEEKNWIKEKLGATDRVTQQEAAMVHRIEDAPEFLKPLEERYGRKEAEKIKRLFTVQARIGIQRKSLEKLADKRMKRSVEAQIEKMRREMENIRKDIGPYAMLQLRHTLPSESSPLWERLADLIQERSSAPQAATINVWDNLKARQSKAAESREESEL